MHPELRRVFDFFANRGYSNVAIIGSAVREFSTANDVDVLFLAGVNFRALCEDLEITYRGKWVRGDETIRQVKTKVSGVSKPVQLTQNSATEAFEDHPYAVLMADGTVLNAGRFFDKRTGGPMCCGEYARCMSACVERAVKR